MEEEPAANSEWEYQSVEPERICCICGEETEEGYQNQKSEEWICPDCYEEEMA